jgi:ribonuclease HII
MGFDPASVGEYPVIIGCDEVGTGALCGPVVAAAVWFDPTAIPSVLFEELDDSKQLTRKKRARLALEIRKVARVALASSSAGQIDKRGLRPATLSAMRRAILGLKIDAPVQVDGIVVPPRIPAASIVAKVFRDRMMIGLAKKFPGYRWEKNVGYGTAEHLEAINRLGPTVYHRRSYAPVLQLALSFTDGFVDVELECAAEGAVS